MSTSPIRPGAAAELSPQPVNGLFLQARRMSRDVRGAGRVLNGITLDIAPGQLTVIAGSSGAGKTVLLEILAGLSAPTEGEVLHDGEQPEPPGREFGFVPQEDIIHRELALHRTLVYAAGLRMPPGTRPQTVTATVDRVLDTLGLSERAGTPVRALSGGERKRAGIAVELLTRPRVLFLDEPTSGLDPVTGAELLRTLRALAEDGTTVVLTTHVLADVLSCDQVVSTIRPSAPSRFSATVPPRAASTRSGPYTRTIGAPSLCRNVRNPVRSWSVSALMWGCTRSIPMCSIQASPAVTSGMDRKLTVPSSKAASPSARTCH